MRSGHLIGSASLIGMLLASGLAHAGPRVKSVRKAEIVRNGRGRSGPAQGRFKVAARIQNECRHCDGPIYFNTAALEVTDIPKRGQRESYALVSVTNGVVHLQQGRTINKGSIWSPATPRLTVDRHRYGRKDIGRSIDLVGENPIDGARLRIVPDARGGVAAEIEMGDGSTIRASSRRIKQKRVGWKEKLLLKRRRYVREVDIRHTDPKGLTEALRNHYQEGERPDRILLLERTDQP